MSTKTPQRASCAPPEAPARSDTTCKTDEQGVG